MTLPPFPTYSLGCEGISDLRKYTQTLQKKRWCSSQQAMRGRQAHVAYTLLPLRSLSRNMRGNVQLSVSLRSLVAVTEVAELV